MIPFHSTKLPERYAFKAPLPVSDSERWFVSLSHDNTLKAVTVRMGMNYEEAQELHEYLEATVPFEIDAGIYQNR